MTKEAYKSYKKKCKELNIKPSKRKDLERDPMKDSTRFDEEPPLRIASPARPRSRTKQEIKFYDAPMDRRFRVTKAWLLRFVEKIAGVALDPADVSDEFANAHSEQRYTMSKEAILSLAENARGVG
jgi:hypothetical protein